MGLVFIPGQIVKNAGAEVQQGVQAGGGVLGEGGVDDLSAGEAGCRVGALTQVVERVVAAVLALHHRLHVLYVVPGPTHLSEYL